MHIVYIYLVCLLRRYCWKIIKGLTDIWEGEKNNRRKKKELMQEGFLPTNKKNKINKQKKLHIFDHHFCCNLFFLDGTHSLCYSFFSPQSMDKTWKEFLGSWTYDNLSIFPEMAIYSSNEGEKINVVYANILFVYRNFHIREKKKSSFFLFFPGI